ncbi:MAG: P-II family nitrogen regulator [Candidatus Hydrogenedentes bacterium]|nr:P-II family nitrogen regulator [Candidatus Hydrogenedentota bacterium]
MKYITAIIQPHMLHSVIKELHECKHYPGMTVSNCDGDGRGRGPDGHYTATMDSLFLKPRKRIEIYCSDDVCEDLVETIRAASHTGNSGDGVIAVMDLSRALRIHTGQEQDKAL